MASVYRVYSIKGSNVIKGSHPVKDQNIRFSLKTLLPQITRYNLVTHVWALAMASVYRVYSIKGSKAIKGSLPVKHQNIRFSLKTLLLPQITSYKFMTYVWALSNSQCL